ncbi:GNAT family N-acetyltransferase [Nocardia sp. XZ_19_385]|uniref:GNAT family N-acetyltransferase n=1 Tax=Nocardia sp. XZ_19_385 TaxID=2769488 RepID=UPI0018907375|nr:GNAT family N-acetyltransferase [Nocardia sp. XZ_19_385]
MARPAESVRYGGIELRRWLRTDEDTLHRIVNESLAHLRPWMGWVARAGEHPREAVRRSLGEAAGAWESGDGYSYAITVRGQVIGSSGLRRCGEPDAWEIGYWVHPAQTGHGYATDAAAALVEQAFSLPGIERVQIWHDAANVASAVVPRRLGFTEIARRSPARDPLTPGEIGIDVVWELLRAETR